MIDINDVEAGRRASVAMDTIAASRQQWQREQRRPKALTAREALAALQFEALLVAVAAANVRAGAVLSDEDFDRLAYACRAIDILANEVLA